jgi:pyrroloquinoline-quinone-dependent sugar dehydrogenase TrAA12-like protein
VSVHIKLPLLSGGQFPETVIDNAGGIVGDGLGDGDGDREGLGDGDGDGDGLVDGDGLSDGDDEGLGDVDGIGVPTITPKVTITVAFPPLEVILIVPA